MSRSYRSPYATDGYGTKRKRTAKTDANRSVRNKDAADGMMYKKLTCSWDICDYKFYLENYKQEYKNGMVGPKQPLTPKEKAKRIRK
jgi:hypothetical protein